MSTLRHELTCSHCNRPYIAKSLASRYCSATCRNGAYLVRQRTELYELRAENERLRAIVDAA